MSSMRDAKPLLDDMSKYESSLEIGTRKTRQHWDFRVSLGVVFTPKEGEACRFDVIRVELVGLFHLPDDFDEEMVQRLVPLNCLAILYGIARGVVAQSTGMMPGGAFMLPPVNFVEAVKQKKTKTPKTRSTTEKKTG